jgi:hypothetical protein
MVTDFGSRPLSPGLHDLFLNSALAKPPVTDLTYAIIFLSALALSAFALCLTWYLSGQPFFANEALKLPRFRFRNYDSLPTEVANGNGIDHGQSQNIAPEPLTGWRYRMGVFQNAVLLALIFVHALILVTDGPDFLRIVFIAYWVIYRSIVVDFRVSPLDTIPFVFCPRCIGDLCTTLPAPLE